MNASLIADGKEKILFSGFAFVVVLSTILSGVFDSLLFFLLPAACLFVYWLIHDVKSVFILLFAILPFSTELELPGGFGLDFPTELLMILFTGIGLILFLANIAAIKAQHILHPISIILILHLGWIIFTAMMSTFPVISLKYTLAKLWYIIPFYCLPFYFFRQKTTFVSSIRFLLLSVSIACIYVWINHAQVGFSFKDINPSVYPIFRNHVNYACLILLTTPFYVLYTYNYKGKWKWLLYSLGAFLLMSIFFSYTRAAMVALVIAYLAYLCIKWKLIQYAMIISAFTSAIVIGNILHENEFIHHAPDYNKTITHKNFDDLIDATAKGEDISTMERAYRWVAGYYMIQDKPITGFGPATFYSNYKSYALTLFQTYVSDNPEKSTIHNYYFLVLVEQGWIGLSLFLFLVIYALQRGQYLYHKLIGFEKQRLLAALICLIMVLTINLINDMIESIKVGSFFFISLSIIVMSDIKYCSTSKSYDLELNKI